VAGSSFFGWTQLKNLPPAPYCAGAFSTTKYYWPPPCSPPAGAAGAGGGGGGGGGGVIGCAIPGFAPGAGVGSVAFFWHPTQKSPHTATATTSPIILFICLPSFPPSRGY